MGTIYRRSKFQWEASVRRAGYPTQRQTFASEAEAKAFVAVLESEIARGVFVSREAAERTTLRQLIEQYAEEEAPKHKGASAEVPRLLSMARRKISEHAVARLTPRHFAKYRDERLKQVAPATVDRELGLFQQVLETARREWNFALAENPVRTVSRPKFNNSRKRLFRDNEEDAVRSACGRSRAAWVVPLVGIALETAMREGELVRIEWRHVDLRRRVLHLPDTKNGSPRDIPLSILATEILAGIDTSREGLVFPLTANAVKLAWSRVVARAKADYLELCEQNSAQPNPEFLKDLHFHDLRHIATTRLAEKVSNVVELASITGHKDMNSLKRYYHPSAENLAKKLDG